jgi:hypothetical protein
MGQPKRIDAFNKHLDEDPDRRTREDMSSRQRLTRYRAAGGMDEAIEAEQQWRESINLERA